MHAITDVLQYAKDLEDAGVPADQANIHAKKMASLLENNVATKQDIENLSKDILHLETRLESKITVVEQKVNSLDSKLNWIIGIITLFAALAGLPIISKFL